MGPDQFLPSDSFQYLESESCPYEIPNSGPLPGVDVTCTMCFDGGDHSRFFSPAESLKQLVFVDETKKWLIYIFAILWGIGLGWFYATETLFFSMILPKGQEAEFTGFYVNCTMILVWLPPLVFSIMNEAGINMRWGLASFDIFFIIAIGLLCMVSPWNEVLEEVQKNDNRGDVNNI